MAKPFANSGDPDQMLHSAASDLGLHCLPITFLRISRLQQVILFNIYQAMDKFSRGQIDDVFLIFPRK